MDARRRLDSRSDGRRRMFFHSANMAIDSDGVMAGVRFVESGVDDLFFGDFLLAEYLHP